MFNHFKFLSYLKLILSNHQILFLLFTLRAFTLLCTYSLSISIRPRLNHLFFDIGICWSTFIYTFSCTFLWTDFPFIASIFAFLSFVSGSITSMDHWGQSVVGSLIKLDVESTVMRSSYFFEGFERWEFSLGFFYVTDLLLVLTFEPFMWDNEILNIKMGYSFIWKNWSELVGKYVTSL